MILKIGLHKGAAIAVTLNERLDYFGQTVNIASRVQGLAESRAIFATRPVIDHPKSTDLLSARGLIPVPQQRQLRGIPEEFAVYEIP